MQKYGNGPLRTSQGQDEIFEKSPVKPAGTQQGLVQDLRTVGCCQTHDALGRLEAIDLV